jgi:hypothetical protein
MEALYSSEMLGNILQEYIMHTPDVSATELY